MPKWGRFSSPTCQWSFSSPPPEDENGKATILCVNKTNLFWRCVDQRRYRCICGGLGGCGTIQLWNPRKSSIVKKQFLFVWWSDLPAELESDTKLKRVLKEASPRTNDEPKVYGSPPLYPKRSFHTSRMLL